MSNVLFSYGPNLLSLFKPVTVTSGTPSVSGANFLTNGILGQYLSIEENLLHCYVDLGSSKTPDFVGLFNHNITAGITQLKGSNTPDFSSPIVTIPITVNQPNCWVDMRSIVGRTARYWELSVSGNPFPIEIGDMSLGVLTSGQCYQWGYVDSVNYLEYLLGTTEFGKLIRVKKGIKQRARTVVFQGTNAFTDMLQAVADYTGQNPGPVIFMPDDTDQTDAWYLDWEDVHIKKTIVDNAIEVDIQLVEQSPGLLST